MPVKQTARGPLKKNEWFGSSDPFLFGAIWACFQKCLLRILGIFMGAKGFHHPSSEKHAQIKLGIISPHHLPGGTDFNQNNPS